MLHGFREAGRFLTALPVWGRAEADFCGSMRRAVPYFGAVGLVIGCLLAGLNRAVHFLPPAASAWLVVGASLLISGGLHIDGLADSADGVLAPAAAARRVEIMGDPRLGAFGVTAVIMAVLGLHTAYSGLLRSHEACSWLVLAPGVSRWSMVLVMYLFPRPKRKERGMAEAAGSGLSPLKVLFCAAAPAAAAAALLGWQVILPWAAAVCVSAGSAAFMANRLGGLTGDTYGAVQVLSEIAFVFWAAFFPLGLLGS